jgi:hypothetical protein
MNNFVMIGAGGTGTHLLRPLTAYLRASHPEGDWLLHVVDGDTVEAKNLERQLFTPGAVTLNKAAAAVSEMADDGHIRAITDYLSETNMATVIQENDTVLICVDNFTVRKRIEDHCLTLTIGDDRAEMTCAQAAALPGGEQTLIANAMTATWMLTALWRTMHHRHELTKRQRPSEATWTELQFDFMKPYVEHIDHRLSKFWNKS